MPRSLDEKCICKFRRSWLTENSICIFGLGCDEEGGQILYHHICRTGERERARRREVEGRKRAVLYVGRERGIEREKGGKKVVMDRERDGRRERVVSR